MSECKYEKKDMVLRDNYFEDGSDVTYGHALKAGMQLLSEACGAFLELPDENGRALAYMCDAAIKWGEAMYRGREPFSYASSEEPVLGFSYEGGFEKRESLKVVK